jgi:hypothetical protein
VWRGQQQDRWHDRLMDLRQAAAANNAKWCDLIARSHGLPT